MPPSLTRPSVAPDALAQLWRELQEELDILERDRLRRRLTPADAQAGALARLDGRERIVWCSNDYLGLSQHPRVIEAAQRAAAEGGVGARASRLLAGTVRCHRELEEALAAWAGTEAAVVFASGYLANLGTLGALLARGDFVLVDRLAHASLIDAVRASGAAWRVFRHNDAAHVARLLERAPSGRRRMVVTEGIFSMEGDRAPLADLLAAAERHGAVVYLDDAHGAFCAGPTGRGSPEVAGLPAARFLYMGTLGKALGCQGGFVAGPSALIELLHTRARTFVYATALAVPVAAAAREAVRVACEESQWRRQLGLRVERLAERLRGLPGGAGDATSHIRPVVLGQSARALAVARRLWEAGHWAPAIRPPTVPRGSARLRLSVTAVHTDAQIDTLTDALAQALRDEPD